MKSGPTAERLLLLMLSVPEVAFAGTVSTISVLETLVTVPSAPLKNTVASFEKLLPVIVTDVPTGPWVGLIEAITGGNSSSSFLHESNVKIAARIQQTVSKKGLFMILG